MVFLDQGDVVALTMVAKIFAASAIILRLYEQPRVVVVLYKWTSLSKLLKESDVGN